MPTAQDNGQPVSRISRGRGTGSQLNISYRLGKLIAHNLLDNKIWLDCGCADGSYTFALIDRGAKSVVGVDIELDRVQKALSRGVPNASFCQSPSENIPFHDATFDGVLINEVLEHVGDEAATLEEIFRILRPGGVVALMSPNRWFPFEGHGAQLSPTRRIMVPMPVLPWLPKIIGDRFMRARNYWPRELERLVRQAGFNVIARQPILAVFEFYPWMPKSAIKWYQRSMPQIENLPGVRQLMAVSTLVLGQRPG